MDKHACKLCFRRFANGRALGGHMRSHVAAASPPSPSLSPASSSSSEDDAFDEAAGLGYVLRENPKKSFKLVDPEFDAGAGSSIVVQDRESETESPRGDNRRRSKRHRGAEQEPASSISDATTEEDVALSLMMLSRDSWSRSDPSDSSDDDERVSPAARSSRRSRFQCGTCNKVFRSYQALGGHRASHKKESKDSTKQSKPSSIPIPQIHEATESSDANADRVHECPICFRVFSSGQALGGHKRSHLTTTATVFASPLPHLPPPPPPPPPPSTPKLIDSFIDLNLPAPIDDDVELSAVSDPDFSRR
ncbi:beta-beta-alpha zinc fingers domain-containing protein [Dioscorea alata]|uniref:Beta-beta-alpha zinc fingers domain-containing protein n=1 Tax=Dioscorea alata TaxID=55571 RepID=A0ACB7UGH3_DIOAL|nr:beta-beta-alpha zinc fingers domain-containing protein [Dioscorea alata]